MACYERDDSPQRAIAYIRQLICTRPEFSEARASVVAAALEVCRGRTVAEMRELGGFSEVISREIDALPSKYRVDYGSLMYPRCVVSVLREFVPQMREEVQWSLARAQT